MRPESSRVGGAGVPEGDGEDTKGEEDDATDDTTPGVRDRRREAGSAGPRPAASPFAPLSSPSSPPTAVASSGGDDGENGEDDKALANESEEENNVAGKWGRGKDIIVRTMLHKLFVVILDSDFLLFLLRRA